MLTRAVFSALAFGHSEALLLQSALRPLLAPATTHTRTSPVTMLPLLSDEGRALSGAAAATATDPSCSSVQRGHALTAPVVPYLVLLLGCALALVGFVDLAGAATP